MGLLTSVCLFAGLAGIAPLFRAFGQSEEELRKAQAELERRVRDRTAELAAANEGLQQERYLLHTLMNYLPHNIYFKDAQSRFIRINQAMARFFGLQDPRDAIGKTDVDFFTDEHALQALADEQEIVRTGQGIIDKEEKETWPDGRTTWASSTKLPLYDDAGANRRHLRHLPGHHRAEAGRGSTAGGERGGRSGQSGQEHLPGEHEP